MNTFARYTIPLLKARQVIKDLRIEEPSEIEVDAISAFYKAPVRYEKMKGCDGRMVRTGECGIITVCDSISYEGQKRFVIAHELGHFLLHPQIRQIDEVNISQMQDWSTKQAAEEIEANLFAAELLMPDRFFELDLKGKRPSFELISELATKFRTTLTAAAIQFIKYTTEECALVASIDLQRKWYVTSASFEFWLRDESRIHPFTCAAEMLKHKRDRGTAKNVVAGAWLKDYDVDSKEYITEDSRLSKNSRMVLSLIWIHAAI